jgi:hypothetical protein
MPEQKEPEFTGSFCFARCSAVRASSPHMNGEHGCN